MRIVELKAVRLSKTIERIVAHQPYTQGVLQTGRHQKVLLTQSQYLAVLTTIIGIQHHRDVFSSCFSCD